MEGIRILSEYVTQKLLSLGSNALGFGSTVVQIPFRFSYDCISMYPHLGSFFAPQTSSRMLQKVLVDADLWFSPRPKLTPGCQI